jgi:hypothetical protein
MTVRDVKRISRGVSVCPKCREVDFQGWPICTGCGANTRPAKLICESCGAAYPLEADLCPKCGREPSSRIVELHPWDPWVNRGSLFVHIFFWLAVAVLAGVVYALIHFEVIFAPGQDMKIVEGLKSSYEDIRHDITRYAKNFHKHPAGLTSYFYSFPGYGNVMCKSPEPKEFGDSSLFVMLVWPGSPHEGEYAYLLSESGRLFRAKVEARRTYTEFAVLQPDDIVWTGAAESDPPLRLPSISVEWTEVGDVNE